MESCCGLITANKVPVPLKSIEVEVKVRDHVATVSSTLQYENKEERPLEAVFVFPLPGDAAVCHFSAKIGQTEVVAEVWEKQKAREEYDDALSSGQQAFLLEESEESPDVFSLSVGALPPGESASIRLEYVTELAVQADDGLRFCLPAVLNPRYQPQGGEGVPGGGGSAQGTSVPASLVPYSLSITAHVSSPRPITKVESKCSLDPLKYLNAEQTQATVSLAAGHKFDRDVELLIYYKDAHQPTAVVEAGKASAKPGSLMGDPVVMLSLYPEFPSAVMSSMTSCGEFLFVVDRSGSMDCPMGYNSSGQGPMDHNAKKQDRISSARDTLLLLLKSLPMGCHFNIYGFGNNYTHIFPKSVEYSQKTMEEALKEVEKMKADMGGTEILQPLKHIYSQPCIPSQPRQLFIFTDGEVFNTKEVLDLVKRNAGSHRCFSFGIGEGASTALITGMAREGGGHDQFITGSDRMQPKVMQSLRFALQPAVVDISVTWDVPKGMSVTPLSPPITTLFQGQRSLLYAQLSGESAGVTEGCVTVKYSLADQPCQNQLHFSLKPSEDTGLTVHRLGARTLIRSLEIEEREGQGGGVKERVVELSVQSGVSSAFTAFIAVNKGDGKAVQGPLLRRDVPAPMFLCSGLTFGPPAPQPAFFACTAMETCFLKYCRDELGTAVRKDVVRNSPPRQNFLNDDFQCDDDWAAPEDLCLDMGKPTRMGAMKYLAVDEEEEEMKVTAHEEPPPPSRDPLLQLISLQKASGSWLLETALAVALEKTSEELAKLKPAQVNEEVWGTILALVWLHGFKMEAEEEWQLLAMKAVLWLRAQKVPCVTECVEAGNALLGCKVQREALGL